MSIQPLTTIMHALGYYSYGGPPRVVGTRYLITADKTSPIHRNDRFITLHLPILTLMEERIVPVDKVQLQDFLDHEREGDRVVLKQATMVVGAACVIGARLVPWAAPLRGTCWTGEDQ